MYWVICMSWAMWVMAHWVCGRSEWGRACGWSAHTRAGCRWPTCTTRTGSRTRIDTRCDVHAGRAHLGSCMRVVDAHWGSCMLTMWVTTCMQVANVHCTHRLVHMGRQPLGHAHWRGACGVVHAGGQARRLMHAGGCACSRGG